MTSPIQLTIQYSVACEGNRVFQILQHLPWYQEHRYHIDLPKGILSEKSSLTEILEIIAQEYLENWEKKYVRQFQNLPFEHSLTKVTVVFTFYGTSGSYEPPQEIIINIRNKTAGQILKTFVHELIHLIIHPLVEHDQLTHTEKERLVDLIVQKEFFSEAKVQVFSKNENLGFIQASFDQWYPDINKIFSDTSWKSKKINR